MSDAEVGDGAEEHDAAEAESMSDEGIPPDYASDEGEDAGDAPFFVEVWNDYDPSMRFVSIFPVGEKEGAVGSSVAYYIIEPGKHTGLHNDNAEEIVFVAEGEGEVFVIGSTKRLEAGQFVVFPAGVDHDVYAQGSVAMRLLSFFPTTEILSTFQQEIYPVGGNVLSSKPPQSEQPVVTELDPNNLPEGFPFDLSDLGMAVEQQGEARELTPTEIALGFTEPGKPPEKIEVRISEPGGELKLVSETGQDTEDEPAEE